MKNFKYINPTKIVFGKGRIATLKKEIPPNSAILMVYGGGSIKRNGIYQQVKEALKGFKMVEFGGVGSNPPLEYLLGGLELIKVYNIDFILAVGGGSVIDSVKFLAAASVLKEDEPRSLLYKKTLIKEAMPFGTVLTLPGTSSEMNSVAVITIEDTLEKRSIVGPALFPKFSILDPEVVASVPIRYIQNGLADSLMHVLEQYLTYPVNAIVQDRMAESILSSIIEIAPLILSEPGNYEHAANFMWCSTWAQNGLLEKGVPGDWTSHHISHELTALHHIDHARALVILFEAYFTFTFQNKKEKMAQYAERVWNIDADSTDEKAQKAIDKTIAFFRLLDIKTRLSDYTDNYENTAEIIAERFQKRGMTALGEHRNITPDNVMEIIKKSY